MTRALSRLCLVVLAVPASALTSSSPVAWRAASPSGAALEVYADDSYALLAPGGSAWLASAPTAVHCNGAWYSSAPGGGSSQLTRLGAGAGANGGYEVRYLAGGATNVSVSFALDASTGAFVFTQRFPGGASGVATQTPSNASAAAARLGEFASSTTPATQFPAFLEAPGSPSAASLGFLSWAGRFFQTIGQPGGGAGAALTQAATGAEGGPIVLFEGTPCSSPGTWGAPLPGFFAAGGDVLPPGTYTLDDAKALCAATVGCE
jgi:hypothetical protein